GVGLDPQAEGGERRGGGGEGDRKLLREDAGLSFRLDEEAAEEHADADGSGGKVGLLNVESDVQEDGHEDDHDQRRDPGAEAEEQQHVPGCRRVRRPAFGFERAAAYRLVETELRAQGRDVRHDGRGSGLRRSVCRSLAASPNAATDHRTSRPTLVTSKVSLLPNPMTSSIT